MARTDCAFDNTVRNFRAAYVDIETWSSVFAPVGMESTEAGWARTLFSETIDAAVYCRIIRPEFTPGFTVRFAGRLRLCAESSIDCVRRSEMFPSSCTAMVRKSAARAIGCPWKLPAE